MIDGEIGSSAEQDVGKLYRSLAKEKAPEPLDQRVLQHAKRAAKREDTRWLRWLRPAIAGAVVSISLIVVAGQFDLWNLTPPASGDGDVVQDFDDAARESSARIREFGGAVTPQVLNPDSLPADTYQNVAPSTSTYCREAQIAGRAAWEACISALHTSGRDAEANEERRKLHAAFANKSP